MLPQYRCDNTSRLLLTLNAGKQRSYASQGEIGIERRPRDAGYVCPGGECFGILAVRGNCGAADDIGVPIEIFGRGVNDVIRAERDGLLKSRRQKCVIDRDFRAG